MGIAVRQCVGNFKMAAAPGSRCAAGARRGLSSILHVLPTRAAVWRRGDAHKECRMAEQTRIVIVDDHPFVREGLKQLLAGQSEFAITAGASTVQEAREAIAAQPPDVAVVDLALGRDDGVDLVRWLREEHPTVRVLVLSMQEEALYAERLLRLGVSGYVMKNAAGTDFLGALRKVARGQRHVSAAMGERLLSQVARGRTPGADEDPVSALTERELEVFRLI